VPRAKFYCVARWLLAAAPQGMPEDEFVCPVTLVFTLQVLAGFLKSPWTVGCAALGCLRWRESFLVLPLFECAHGRRESATELLMLVAETSV